MISECKQCKEQKNQKQQDNLNTFISVWKKPFCLLLYSKYLCSQPSVTTGEFKVF